MRYLINNTFVGPEFETETEISFWAIKNADILAELEEYELDSYLADNLDVYQLLDTYTAPFAPNYYKIIKAALICGISYDDIDEAYQGEFDSDIEFAQHMADGVGAFDENASWPHSCIDWDHAAHELMFDYISHEGYYFRNI